MNEKKKVPKWLIVFIVLITTGLLCAHPMGRLIVLWLFPGYNAGPSVIGSVVTLAALVMFGIKFKWFEKAVKNFFKNK